MSTEAAAAAPAPPSLSIGEINPNGGNNAIYCEIGLDDGQNSSNNVIAINGLAIYSVFDAAQNKNKYWMRFILATKPGRPKALPPGAKILMVPAQSTFQVYWQVENTLNKDICTVGEAIQKAATTSALVIRQTVDPTKPAQ